MATKTYKIFENREVKLPWNWSRDGISLAKNITWDEKNTTIVSAKLRFTVKPSRGYVKSWTELNYVEIGRFTWSLLDDSLRSDEFDIIGVIVNGNNYFKVIVAKEFANIDAVNFMVSEEVVITYEGSEPEVTPDWKKYLEYGAVGIGVAGGVITVAGMLGEKKK